MKTDFTSWSFSAFLYKTCSFKVLPFCAISNPHMMKRQIFFRIDPCYVLYFLVWLSFGIWDIIQHWWDISFIKLFWIIIILFILLNFIPQLIEPIIISIDILYLFRSNYFFQFCFSGLTFLIVRLSFHCSPNYILMLNDVILYLAITDYLNFLIVVLFVRNPISFS